MNNHDLLIGDEFISIQKTNDDINGFNDYANRLVFKTKSGQIWVMGHPQDCCETVELEDIIGDLNDLLNSPILKVEHKFRDPSHEESITRSGDCDIFHFWTIATLKNYVDFRWYGDSNGYYSMDVDFLKINDEDLLN